MKNYAIRIEVEPAGFELEDKLFLKFIRSVPTTLTPIVVSKLLETESGDLLLSLRRKELRKELAKVGGTIVYVPGPPSLGGTDMRLYFENEAAYGMFVLKYS